MNNQTVSDTPSLEIIVLGILQTYTFFGALVLDLLPEAGSFLTGLILIRTYTLCQGYRPMAIALVVTFLTYFVAQIYDSLPTLILIINIATVILDALAFVAVIHRLWGIWRLGRSLGLQNSDDLVTSIVRQGILRLSTLLICKSTIDLRRQNTQRSVPNNQSASLQNNPARTLTLIFERMHESIMTEMGEINDPINIDLTVAGAEEGDSERLPNDEMC
ncbi:hypothetical protein Clacol_005849 [Clathrus columnatus]|uniref:Uncharacterized protein n=1 Tax=Clathrus columnatus TaxID=1419009 RepID=A0AAV5AEK0_9AGAM|nr:hypothetical protein Clacol_005849 [Clathrus columnatus]